MKKNVWSLSFECSGVVKVGGLGEAVFNMNKQLLRRGFDITLFMPSHGIQKIPDAVKRLQLRKSDIEIQGKISGRAFLPYREPFKYKIGVWEGKIEGIKIVLFGGLNENSSRILDEKIVYKTNCIEDKAILLARGIKGYIENLDKLDASLPDIIHAHDYHTIPAAVSARQDLEKLNHKIALVLTIHLMSRKRVLWKYLNEKWCGIKSEKHFVYLNGRRTVLTHKEVLRKAKGYLEAFGAMESHIFTTVSRNYLEDEVMKLFGPSCECKKDFIWNGCDWKYETLLKQVYNEHKSLRDMFGKEQVERFDLRRFFLTKAIAELNPEEPVLDEGLVKEAVYSLKEPPFLGEGKVEPFHEDGPMILMTGRLTQQKGVDTLLKAVPRVVRKIPDVKFVLMLLPTQNEINLVRKTAKLASEHYESVRVIFGKAPSIYFLAHLCSDVFTCPSKWEPFGIMALEAMATGNPVVATRTGGLKETIVDINEDLNSSTGILVPTKDHRSLAKALISLIATMKIQEEFVKGKLSKRDKQRLINLIGYDNLREMVSKDALFGYKMRENCIKRVEECFRWNKVVDMLIKVYERAITIAKQLEKA